MLMDNDAVVTVHSVVFNMLRWSFERVTFFSFTVETLVVAVELSSLCGGHG